MISKGVVRISADKRSPTDNPKAEVREKNGFGKGVYAAKAIAKDEPIAEFDGEFYGYKPWQTMPDALYKFLFSHVIQCGPRRWRAARGIADRFNHSCEPNCGINGLYTVVAMRDIKKGEELTWDYAMTEDFEWDMGCKCGSPACRKTIDRFKSLPMETREKYKGYISDWLVKKYSL